MSTNQENAISAITNMIEKNNVAEISGKLSNEAEFSHERDGEKFYTTKITVKRLSSAVDEILVTIPERLLDGGKIENVLGKFVSMRGEFRSYNKIEDNKSRLKLNFFAQHVEENNSEKYENHIYLKGFLCKKPVKRSTPYGREICDFLLAVNRTNSKKSDYIPCIAWGRNANFGASLGVGDELEISGRMQSREYSKELEDGTVQERVAYEISCELVMLKEKNEEKVLLN